MWESYHLTSSVFLNDDSIKIRVDLRILFFSLSTPKSVKETHPDPYSAIEIFPLYNLHDLYHINVKISQHHLAQAHEIILWPFWWIWARVYSDIVTSCQPGYWIITYNYITRGSSNYSKQKIICRKESSLHFSGKSNVHCICWWTSTHNQSGI